jgi:hypothetical protein
MEPTACRRFVAVAAALLAACSGPTTALVPPAPASPARNSSGVKNASAFEFTTLDDPYSTSFNRLTGINNDHRITGYEGSGGNRDPSEGYRIYPPYAGRNYRTIEYPGASQTVATSLNNRRTNVGYYVARKDGRLQTYGFVESRGIWSSYEDPHARGATGSTMIFGLNDAGTAVGAARVGAKTYSFELDVGTGKFKPIAPQSGTNPVASGINGHGDIVGYMTKHGKTIGFLRKNGQYRVLAYPHAAATLLLAITVDDRIVGSFVDRSGVTHGLLLMHPSFKSITWQRIDDPNGVQTTATGINMHDEVVGWYVDAKGKNHGFFASP